MSDPFLGEIRNFGFNFAPQYWAVCDGSLLPIGQNQALFSLLGTQYGGDGVSTFGIPDLRGRVSMGAGQGPGLTLRMQGEESGTETVTLTSGELPAHSHTVAAASAPTTKNPADAVPAFTVAGSAYGTTADLSMSPTMIGPVPGNQPHNNMQPFLVTNWCISLHGIYPSRG